MWRNYGGILYCCNHVQKIVRNILTHIILSIWPYSSLTLARCQTIRFRSRECSKHSANDVTALVYWRPDFTIASITSVSYVSSLNIRLCYKLCKYNLFLFVVILIETNFALNSKWIYALPTYDRLGEINKLFMWIFIQQQASHSKQTLLSCKWYWLSVDGSIHTLQELL